MRTETELLFLWYGMFQKLGNVEQLPNFNVK